MQELKPELIEQCRNALSMEQNISLAETKNWSHVDRAKVHSDWDVLYRQIALLIDTSQPADENVQKLIAEHYDIVSRFYKPLRNAYIGMSLFYNENKEMFDFHTAYHPKMVDFMSTAMFLYARTHL